MRYVLIGLFILSISLSFAQVKTTVDSIEFGLGQVNHLHLKIESKHTQLSGPSEEEIQKEVPYLRILQDQAWEKNGNLWERHITFSVYDTGKFYLNRLAVMGVKSGRNDTIYTRSLPLIVNYSALPSELGDIKDIMKEPLKFSDFYLLLGMLVALTIAALVLLRYWKVKNQEEKIEVKAPPIPAHITAYGALSQLETEKLWEQDKEKEHQVRLSFIMRSYLNNRFDILATESTTSEILELLKSQHISDDRKMDLKELLQLSDMVKYAKAKPPREYHKKLLDNARLFVKETEEKVVEE